MLTFSDSYNVDFYLVCFGKSLDVHHFVVPGLLTTAGGAGGDGDLGQALQNYL